jgi:hypothetical protein
MIPERLLEVREHNAPGYIPLIDYGAWRVALMRGEEQYLPENIHNLQKHLETDEVFVLLSGRCILFLGEGDAAVTSIHAAEMESYKLYNVKKSCWHSHTFSADALVIIVENRDTTDANSPFVELTPDQRAEIVRLTHEAWQ